MKTPAERVKELESELDEFYTAFRCKVCIPHIPTARPTDSWRCDRVAGHEGSHSAFIKWTKREAGDSG